MHQHRWHALWSPQASDSESSRVAAQQETGGKVGLGSNSINSLGPCNGVDEVIRDDEEIENLTVARRELWGEDGTLDHAEESRAGQRGGLHVPIAADHARTFEAANDGTHMFAHQLVLVVHADRIFEVC